jgi:hypothetical protein
MKAFYPYGQDGGPAPPAAPAAPRLPLGAAEVAAGDGRHGIEVYALERAAEDWLLHAQAFDQPWRLLGRVHHSRLPAEAAEAATELLGDLWTLRHAGRLRFVRSLDLGALGAPRWQRIEARVPRAPLEHALRDEGFEVREVRGPVGTTEHMVVLRRA